MVGKLTSNTNICKHYSHLFRIKKRHEIKVLEKENQNKEVKNKKKQIIAASNLLQ